MFATCSLAVAVAFTQSVSPESQAVELYAIVMAGKTERERDEAYWELYSTLRDLREEGEIPDRVAVLAATLLFADIGALEKHNILSILGSSKLAVGTKKAVLALVVRYRPLSKADQPRVTNELGAFTGLRVDDLEGDVVRCIEALSK